MVNSFLYQPATERRYAWRFGYGLPRMVTLDTWQLASQSIHGLTLGFSNVDTLTNNAYPAQNASFGYDAADRLTAAASIAAAQPFGVDTVSNRTARTRQGAGYHFGLDTQSNRLATWSGAAQSCSFGPFG